MPRLLDAHDASDSDVDANGYEQHVESGIEADVDAKDQLKEDLMSDIEETSGKKAARTERQRVSPTASNAVEDEDDEEEDDEDKYEVEKIVDHEFRRKKGKNQPWVLLYNVKWKGYDSSENTLEPEDNLVESRDLLAAYHHKIGGAPQPPTQEELKKKKSSRSLQADSVASTTDDSPAPAPKRQKRTRPEDNNDSGNDTFGAWTPVKESSWEKMVQTIETVEREERTNDLYILLKFKNGKKSRVKNTLLRQKAPQKLLDFYEAHLSV